MRTECAAAISTGKDAAQPHPEETAGSGRLEGRGVRSGLRQEVTCDSTAFGGTSGCMISRKGGSAVNATRARRDQWRSPPQSRESDAGRPTIDVDADCGRHLGAAVWIDAVQSGPHAGPDAGRAELGQGGGHHHGLKGRSAGDARLGRSERRQACHPLSLSAPAARNWKATRSLSAAPPSRRGYWPQN